MPSAERGAGQECGPRLVRVLAALVFCVLENTGAAASEAGLPPVPKHHFNDDAGLVGPDVARRLDARLVDFEHETSSQVVVAIFGRLESPSLEDFTIRTAQSWRVGQKGLNNGVILFVFVEGHRLRFEVGYGLEAALPDAAAGRILDGIVRPAFRAGDYGGGFDRALDAVFAAIRGEAAPNSPAAVPAGAAGTRRPFTQGRAVLLVGGLAVAAFLVLFLIAVVVSRLRSRKGGRGSATYHSGGMVIDGSGVGDVFTEILGGVLKFGVEAALTVAGGAFGGGGASGDW